MKAARVARTRSQAVMRVRRKPITAAPQRPIARVVLKTMYATATG